MAELGPARDGAHHSRASAEEKGANFPAGKGVGSNVAQAEVSKAFRKDLPVAARWVPRYELTRSTEALHAQASPDSPFCHRPLVCVRRSAHRGERDSPERSGGAFASAGQRFRRADDRSNASLSVGARA